VSVLSEAYLALQTELAELLDDTPMRVESDLAKTLGRRDVVIGPPAFTWEGMCFLEQPTSMTYTVYVIEDLGERAVERLLELLPALLEAVGKLHGETTVTACAPGVYPSGTTDLPCYQITAETTL